MGHARSGDRAGRAEIRRERFGQHHDRGKCRVAGRNDFSHDRRRYATAHQRPRLRATSARQLVSAVELKLIPMRKSKWIKILASIGIGFLIVFVVIPPFTRRWYKNHSVIYAPPVPVNSWKKFSSPEGKFSVWFPGVPEFTNVVVSASNTNFSQSCFFVWNRQTEYSVSYIDYSKILEKIKPEQQFDIYESGVADEVGKIVYQKDIKFANYPGREFEYVVEGKVNYSGRVRLIFVGERLYQMIVNFLPANPHPTDRETFFNSFRLQN